MAVRVVVDRSELTKAGIEKALATWVAYVLLAIEGLGKINAPVLTGTLRRSIHTQMDGDMSGSVGTDLEYAIFVHDGTRYMAARPFLLLAAQQALAEADRKLKTLLGGL